MRFYSNVSYDRKKDEFCVVEYDNGERSLKRVPCEPLCYVLAKPHQDTPLRSLDGKRVVPKRFDSRKSFEKFIETYKNVSNQQLIFGFGYREFELIHSYINENYHGEVVHDMSQLSVVTLDIETDSEGGFPDIEQADKEVIAITVCRDGMYVVLGTRPYKKEKPNVNYIKCKNEADLLEKFIMVWNTKQFAPDIVTGWNVEFFDIPYLTNRIKRILGDGVQNKLSPFGFYNSRFITTEKNGSTTTEELKSPAGMTVLDYLVLYRKFSYTPQESYKLDHIANMELGEKKLDFRALGYETLDEFYKKDFQNFINYNIVDVELVYKLEDKLKLIEQACALAYNAKVNMIETLTTVRLWDVIIHNHLLEKNIIVPYHDRELGEKVDKKGPIQGAYVKDPICGMHNWVVSFDLNSLYPHLIMQYNISPETYVGRKENVDVENLINGELKTIQPMLKEKNVTFCGTGCMFDRDRQGFLPELMQTTYNGRVVWKTRMLEAKKKYEANPSKQLANEIARCQNMQQALKIQLNSAYGALGNKYFRWFDRKYAESITLSGQLAIRWMEKNINLYLNKVLETDGVDYVIACDTDSMYLDLEKYVKKFCTSTDTKEIVKQLDDICQNIFEPLIDKHFDELGDLVNAYQQKMKMKREVIAEKGIWTGKKHYILLVHNNEGVQYAEPKLKYQGIEAVRSSTPRVCRTKITEALKIIMTQTEDDVIQFIESFKEEFEKLSFNDIAFPRGVQQIKKWKDGNTVHSGCPIHVRGAITYNNAIEALKLEAKYPLIRDGDKLLFCYMLMPNPTFQNVLATPGYLPPELKVEHYIDYDTQFNKAFLAPLETILNSIGWKTEKHRTIEDFFA